MSKVSWIQRKFAKNNVEIRSTVYEILNFKISGASNPTHIQGGAALLYMRRVGGTENFKSGYLSIRCSESNDSLSENYQGLMRFQKHFSERCSILLQHTSAQKLAQIQKSVLQKLYKFIFWETFTLDFFFKFCRFDRKK